jgi:hypothetical protein
VARILLIDDDNAVNVLAKPVSNEALIAAINELLPDGKSPAQPPSAQ